MKTRQNLLLGSALLALAASSGEDSRATHLLTPDQRGEEAMVPFPTRDLRSHVGTVGSRTAKSGKGAKGHKSYKHGGRPAPHDSSKTGKSSRGHAGDAYYVAPFGCPEMCVDADGAGDFGMGSLRNAVRSCSARGMHGEYTQRWTIDESDGMVRVESHAYEGRCIGVNHRSGDRASRAREACEGGILALLPCHNPATMWYFTGGQLASFFCWSRGVSSKMSVSYDGEGKCRDELRAHSQHDGSPGNMMSMMDTFMFVSSEDMEMMYDPSHGGKSHKPEYRPTMVPTMSPTRTIPRPTKSPTVDEPNAPTVSPSDEPTQAPTYTPSFYPTYNPTLGPVPLNPRRPWPDNRGVGPRNGIRADGPIETDGSFSSDKPEDNDDVFHLGRR